MLSHVKKKMDLVVFQPSGEDIHHDQQKLYFYTLFNCSELVATTVSGGKIATGELN